MANETYERENESVVLNFLFLIKKYILFIVIAVFAACAVGYGYAKLRTPNYYAKEKLSYTVTSDSAGYDVKAVNAMIAYVDTVVDFCMTGIVYDRANAIYHDYRYNRRTLDQLDEFLAQVEEENLFADNNGGYASLINENTASAKKYSKDDMINIEISVQNSSAETAKILTRVYACAIRLEAKNAFGEGFTTNIGEGIVKGSGISGITATKDTSTLKILLIAGVIGVVLSLGVAYLLYVTDRSVSTGEELTRITGVPLLSVIRNKEMKRNER
ncbi:MAG: hypothetical protein ACI4RO_05430 [Candidatus Scatosoma sp.]